MHQRSLSSYSWWHISTEVTCHNDPELEQNWTYTRTVQSWLTFDITGPSWHIKAPFWHILAYHSMSNPTHAHTVENDITFLPPVGCVIFPLLFLPAGWEPLCIQACDWPLSSQRTEHSKPSLTHFVWTGDKTSTGAPSCCITQARSFIYQA